MTFLSIFENEVVKGVIITLIASAIVGLFTFIVKNRRKFRIYKLIALIINITSSGINAFFYDKSTLRNQLGTVGQELSKCKKSLIYIGYTMSDIIEQDLNETIYNLITKQNIKFEFCILDDSSSNTALNAYAEYTGRDIDYTQLTLRKTIRVLSAIQDRLPNEKKNYLKIYKHDKFLPSSCFLGDINEEYGWIHFNYKAPKSVKLQDFGFVISNSNFYSHMKASYLTLLQEIYSYNKEKSKKNEMVSEDMKADQPH